MLAGQSARAVAAVLQGPTAAAARRESPRQEKPPLQAGQQPPVPMSQPQQVAEHALPQLHVPLSEQE